MAPPARMDRALADVHREDTQRGANEGGRGMQGHSDVGGEEIGPSGLKVDAIEWRCESDLVESEVRYPSRHCY